MIGKRRPGFDEARASRRQRAFDLFAAWLEHHDEPRELDDRRFTELLQEHPDLQDELQSIRAGLEKFRGLAPSRLRAALDATPRIAWRRILPRVAAAALVITVIGVAWHYRRSPQPLEVPSAVLSADALAAALIDRGVRWVEETVQPEGPIDKLAANASTGTVKPPAAGAPPPANPTLERATAEAVRAVAGTISYVTAIAGASGGSAGEALVPGLVRVKETLRKADAGSWRERLLASLDSKTDQFDLAKPFLLAMNQDPKIRALIQAAGGEQAPSETMARLIARITNQAILRVRAIDLDADGIDFPGATVFAQPVDLPNDTLGAPRRLGVTPLQPCQLDCGDWRITAIDSTGPELRFSELRLLATPGEDLGLRVMFFRETTDVAENMAYRKAASSRFGKPRRLPHSPLDLPEQVVQLDELWIDPCEVTCAEYSKFYVDVLHHPGWFDGVLPVHRPEVLSEDGSCPLDLVRRPIVEVSWEEAVVFATWAGKRLPMEREWERVARGTDSENRTYPWGNTFTKGRIDESNSVTSRLPTAKPTNVNGVMAIQFDWPRFEDIVDGEVDSLKYAVGATPEGPEDRVFRMADNVFEYVEDPYISGMTTPTPSMFDFGMLLRVQKGSCWYLACEPLSINWSRSAVVSNLGSRLVGFRCVKTRRPAFEDR